MKSSKKSITTSWWVLVSLLTGFSNNSGATSIEQADSLFNAGLYQEANIAYEKVIFENTGNETLIAKTLLKKSYSYKMQGNYASIDFLLSRCNVNFLDDTLKAQILFEQSLSCYLDQRFKKAKELIMPVLNLNISHELEKASVFLYSLILNELDAWEESRTNLVSFINRTEANDAAIKEKLIAEVNNMYSPDNIPRIKKLKTARTLSFFLPGLGQVYAGKTGKGLISITLVALSGAFTYMNVVDKLYMPTGAGLYMFTYFYFGNVNQLEKLVKDRNTLKRNKINSSLRSSLSSINKQL